MKAWIRAAATLFAVGALAGCATAYKKYGMTGGYADEKLDDTHYVVRFDGNGFADKERVWYFWFYRCAELTAQAGYTYFSLEPIVDNMKKTGFTPGSDQGRLTDAVLRGDADGNIIDVRGGGYAFIYVPGGTITTWHSRAVVAMYRGDVPEKKMVYDAKIVQSMLAAFVHTNGSATPPSRDDIFHAALFGLSPGHQLVNVHQFITDHPEMFPPKAYAPQVGDRYDANKAGAGRGLPNGPMMASAAPAPAPEVAPMPAATPVPVSHAAPPATRAVADSPAVAEGPDAGAARATASQMGCGDVTATGNGEYVAQCSSYRVSLACAGGQCHPTHVVH